MNTHPGRIVSVYQMSALFCEAYLKGCTPENAINGLKKTGIFPFDDTLFQDIDFVAAEVTDVDRHVTENIVDTKRTTRFNENVEQSTNNQPINVNVSLAVPSSSRTNSIQLNSVDTKDETKANENLEQSIENQQVNENNDLCVPSTSGITSNSGVLSNNGIPTTHFYFSSPSQIKPIPKLSGPKKATKRKLGKTVVLTSSPYKNELEAEIKKKEENEIKKNLRLEKKKEIARRNVLKVDKAKEKSESKRTLKAKQKKFKNKYSDDSLEEDNVDCLVCGELYADSAGGEGWIQCTTCKLWAHDACAGVEETMDMFVCDICLN